MNRTALMLLFCVCTADAVQAQTPAQPSLTRGTWLLTAELGGAAFTAFQRVRAVPEDAAGGLPVERRVSASTTATVGASIGYNFAPNADVSPYVRAGVIHHIASGDYESSSNPGLLVAAGLDFQRLTIEVAFDDSDVEFEAAQCDAEGNCRPGFETLNTYEVIASVFWRFR